MIQQLLIQKKEIERIREYAKKHIDKTPLGRELYREADEAHSSVIIVINRVMKMQGRLN